MQPQYGQQQGYVMYQQQQQPYMQQPQMYAQGQVVQGQPLLEAQQYNMYQNQAQMQMGQQQFPHFSANPGMQMGNFGNNLMTHANGVPYPARIKCPFCKEPIMTTVQTKAGSGTWMCCFLLFCLTGWCCCVPFFVEDCQDKIHNCPRCQQVVGIKEYRVCG